MQPVSSRDKLQVESQCTNYLIWSFMLIAIFHFSFGACYVSSSFSAQGVSRTPIHYNIQFKRVTFRPSIHHISVFARAPIHYFYQFAQVIYRTHFQFKQSVVPKQIYDPHFMRIVFRAHSADRLHVERKCTKFFIKRQRCFTPVLVPISCKSKANIRISLFGTNHAQSPYSGQIRLMSSAYSRISSIDACYVQSPY